MKIFLRIVAILVALCGYTWACPSTVPSGVTVCYYIDYTNSGGAASDSNAGTSESAPWLHAPGMHNVSGTPAGHTPGSGEAWIFKGGVTVDYNAFPMNVPWGCGTGSSSCSSGANPNYMGYDFGWYSGASWARPVFDGGGSSGYDTHNQSLITDISHRSSYVIIDNIEIRGIYFGSACSSSGPYSCGAISQYAYSGTDVGWEIKNVEVHYITHCTAAAGCVDPGNEASLLWAKQDTTSSVHDSVVDNTDGSYDCCNAIASWNVYNVEISGVDNAVFGEYLFLHDFTIQNMTLTFASNGVHGNCIHLFGNGSINELIYNGYITCFQGFGPWVGSHNYSGSVNTVFITPTSNNPNGYTFMMTTVGTTSSTQPTWDNATGGTPPGCPATGNTCSDGTAVWTNTGQYPTADEGFLVEEDNASVYGFNLVEVMDGHGSGFELSDYSGGTSAHYNFRHNTYACGTNPTPSGHCISPKWNTINAANNFFITSGKLVNVSDWAASTYYTLGTVLFPSVGNAGNYFYVCTSAGTSGGSGTEPNPWNQTLGGTQTVGGATFVNQGSLTLSPALAGGTSITAPIGSGNGTGNLNITETYPFAPMDSTAAASVGTAAGDTAFCSIITTINAAAGAACLKDTTLGVGYNTTNHTVIFPARTPVSHSATGSWTNGAFEAPFSIPPGPPTGLSVVVF